MVVLAVNIPLFPLFCFPLWTLFGGAERARHLPPTEYTSANG